MTILSIETSLLMLIVWMILGYMVLRMKDKMILYLVTFFHFLLSLYMLNDGHYPFYPTLFFTAAMAISFLGVYRVMRGQKNEWKALKNIGRYGGRR